MKLKQKTFCACILFALFLSVLAFSQEEKQEEAGSLDVYQLDEYTGLNYIPEKKVDVSNGSLRIQLWGSKGAFSVYSVGAKGKKLPLFSSSDSFSSSYFVLRAGKKEYVLNSEGGVACESRRTERGAQLCFLIPKKACFLVDFAFPDDALSADLKSMLRVSLYTINLEDKPQTFTVKGIFDTILGENSGVHFSTGTLPKLNTQKQFHSMDHDRWIRSANKKASVCFLLDGADISKPEAVTLAAVGELSKYWVPVVHDGRSFNSAQAYNNSAVAVNWSTAYLLPQEKDVKTFYISGSTMEGNELISALEQGTVFPVYPSLPSDTDAAEVELSAAAQAVTEEQLDPEYIQNLIDYISSLENGESIEKEELESLNKELDAIFERLRAIKR